MHEHQPSVKRRQVVIDDHLLPLAEHPEVETEDAAVAFGRDETLSGRYDSLHQVLVLTEA